MPRRAIRALVLALVVVSIVPIGSASANHCKTKLDLEVRYAGAKTPDGQEHDAAVNGERAWTCEYVTKHTGRDVPPYIEPGGIEFRIGYYAVLHPTIDEVSINGLGYNKKLKFPKSSCFFICVSFTEWQKMPLPATGTLTVKMLSTGEQVCYPTIGASC